MTRAPLVVTGSTIASRLALLLAMPILGMLVLGGLVAADERNAMTSAREVRQEAELVELLSSIALTLDVESDVITALQEAAVFGLDVNDVESLIEDEPVVEAEQLNLDALFAKLEAQDEDDWADPDSVQRLLAGWGDFNRYRTSPSEDSSAFDELSSDMATAADAALVAQTEQLNASFGQVELGAELTALAQSMEPSRQALNASQDERQALAQYLLPLSDARSEDVLYRELLAANAHYRFSVDRLSEQLPEDYAAYLQRMRSSEDWQSYAALRDDAVAGTRQPAVDLRDPFTLLPLGIVIFVDGFEPIRVLSEIDHQLSIDFTAGAERLERQANDRLRRVVASGLGAAVLMLTTSFFTIRSITRPVRSLLERARHITDGNLETVRPQRSPSDIDMVHTALDEMTANLRTVGAQAEALSAGRLDDDVLNRQVVGPLGASVHGSVARLRSMTTRLEHEATHDSLTGLPNRAAVFALLDRSLTGAIEQRQPLAAVMLDLDGFKQANDNMGHAVGDEVLCHVARRLVAATGGHFVARLGGDEFMVVVTGPEALDEAMTVADAAVAAVAQPMRLSCGLLDVSASAGVVETGFDSWLSPSEVLRRVDLAMYEAKSDVPGQVVRFDQRLHDSLLATTQLSGELHLALDRDEFTLHLQPIVETATGDITGYEALIRWTSPLRGPVSPALFIGIAEQSDLISRIDRWVIRESARVLAEWKHDPVRAGLTLSINVSARHLSRPDLAVEIESAIERHGLKADRYLIEVTESQLIPNLARAEDNLRRLKELGVRLAIDDFGTGYASVAHLRRVAFDRLKIDQSFLAHLADETDRSLASLLVSLGRDLHLEVVAEGIETPQQWQWAADAGCTHGQGYLLGRPQPVDTVDPTRPMIKAQTAGSARR